MPSATLVALVLIYFIHYELPKNMKEFRRDENTFDTEENLLSNSDFKEPEPAPLAIVEEPTLSEPEIVAPEIQNFPEPTWLVILKEPSETAVAQPPSEDENPNPMLVKDPSILQRTSWLIDFLYLKATEDSLVYAQKIPQNPTYNPVIKYIKQDFSYDPGVRTAVIVPVFYDQWKVRAAWTYFIAHPDSQSSYDANYGILAGLATPIIGANGNSQCQKVNGKWDLAMNVLDFDIQKVIPIKNQLMINLSAGIKTAWIKQVIDVQYGNYLIQDPPDNTPQKVKGESHFLGLGPAIGFSANINLPRNFGFFLMGNYTALLGSFKLSTTYSDLLGAPAGSSIEIKDSLQRIVPFLQIEIGLYKRWPIKSSSWLELQIGWEEQIWWDQMRVDWFSSVVSQPNGANLTLNGLYIRNKLDF